MFKKGVTSIKRLVRFLIEVKDEMKKVRWESKKEIFKATSTVVLVVLFLTLFFFASDFLINLSDKLFL